MNKGSSHNIFDEAGKKDVKSQSKIVKENPSLKIEKPNQALPPLQDSDVQAMFDQMIEMKNDLNKKANDLKEAIILSENDVGKFFSDPKNFSPDQWATIQENRSDLEKKVWAVVEKDPKKAVKKHIEDEDTKHRKGKTLGSRRNWIPLR